MELTTYQQQAKMKLISTIVALVVIAGIVIVLDNTKPKVNSLAATPVTTTSAKKVVATTQSSKTTSTSNTDKSASSSSSSSSQNSSNNSSSSNTSGYKDGTYSASVNYFVPRSGQSIKVSITLSNGVITDSSVQNSQGDPTSTYYQQSFASSYKSAVVGQKISTLALGVVGGASDTTQAFDDAVSQIATQAQS